MNTKGLHWLFQRVENNLVFFFPECVIGLWVIFVHSIVPSLYYNKMGVLKEITSCVGIALTNLWAFSGEDQKGERGPESSYGGYIPQQSEEMKLTCPDVLLLILWYLILAKLYNAQDPKQYFYFVQKQRHIANTNQMPEVFDAIFANCHLLKFSSHYIDIIVISFWLTWFSVYK